MVRFRTRLRGRSRAEQAFTYGQRCCTAGMAKVVANTVVARCCVVVILEVASNEGARGGGVVRETNVIVGRCGVRGCAVLFGLPVCARSLSQYVRPEYSIAEIYRIIMFLNDTYFSVRG